ncbi:winged helix DNA-binding domain-containing protein [Streptomyces sp. NPDC090025]|uniref:winged helix DNA-binding domain-containing protein n=1 Tax=Streptomyces sp. NPDC090025 TaxID=3365922 RepID=UPI0038388491
MTATTGTRLIDDTERRARAARRHGLAPQHRLADAVTATGAMTVLHSTEPATPYLSLHARVDDFTRADLADALYDAKTLVKQLAMRRTLFVFPRGTLPAALGSASARVAQQEHARLVKDVESGEIAADGAAWLAAARDAVLGHLSGGAELSAKELREALDELAGQISFYEHKPYGQVLHVAPRVLTWLAAGGELVRGHNAGHWRITRPLWTRMDDWLGTPVAPSGPAEGYADLVARYLRTFGPVTERDLVWWFGATKSAMRTALADVAAAPVRLERDQTGWVLPDDVDPEPAVEPWAALLPALDPTPMGWKDRDFYLAPEFASAIYDRAGNCGTTAWWDGRIIGAYVLDDDARVELVLPDDPGRPARAALTKEAARLEKWLDGEKVNSLYKSPLTTWDR